MPGGIVSPQSTILGSSYSSSAFSAAKAVHLLVLFVALVQRGVGGMVQGGGLRRIRFSSGDWIIGAGKTWSVLYAGCWLQAAGREGVAAQFRPPPSYHTKTTLPLVHAPPPSTGRSSHKKSFVVEFVDAWLLVF